MEWFVSRPRCGRLQLSDALAVPPFKIAAVEPLIGPLRGDYLRIFPVLTDQEDNGAPDIDLQNHRRAERMGFPGRKVSESLVPCGTNDPSRQRLRPRPQDAVPRARAPTAPSPSER